MMQKSTGVEKWLTVGIAFISVADVTKGKMLEKYTRGDVASEANGQPLLLGHFFTSPLLTSKCTG